MKKALVANAADPGQVQHATQKTKTRRDQELDDLRSVLTTPQGRRFIWRLLAHCQVFESIWDPGVRIHFNEGQRNVGLFVMSEVTGADENAVLQMMVEGKRVEKRQEEENEAAQIKPAAEPS